MEYNPLPHMKPTFLPFFWLITSSFLFAQNVQDSLATTPLDEVILTSGRIDLALSKNSRFIQILSKEEIAQSPVQTLAELLQQVAGIDIRRRGVSGMQADLFIRGGGFDQTLLLVDGIKLEDAQTGHHLLNFAPPLEVIERIEIFKGPAARVFGQNAFTGAINIVTKIPKDSQASLGLSGGSFSHFRGEANLQTAGEKSSFIAHYSRNTSEGYRYNTDFENNQVFIKGTFNSEKRPISLLASFGDRKFGANGFYALPSYTEQYEETQASVVALTSEWNQSSWTLKPRVYWRRGQDMYLFVRDNPSLYRNLHISNKMGLALDASRTSNGGTTGIGIDLAKITLSSNNLGKRDRFVTTLFVEHQFQWGDDKWQLTPGISMTKYSDFQAYFFPGVDIGYKLTEGIRIFANSGYTYRIPTFTDLYYSDPTTLGNENLEVEEALTHELGLRWLSSKIQFSAAAFYRKAENLIDYIRMAEDSPFEATNIRSVNTTGLDIETKATFQWNQKPHRVQAGYTYLSDDLRVLPSSDSRYSINSLIHHVTVNYQAQWTSRFSTALAYKYAERRNQNPYTVVDLGFQWQWNSIQLEANLNNLFNAEYTEMNLVPMPLGNGMLGIRVML